VVAKASFLREKLSAEEGNNEKVSSPYVLLTGGSNHDIWLKIESSTPAAEHESKEN
jgi:hypothetical protein